MEVYLVEKLPQALQVASLLIVFFILAVFGHRKTWLSTEIIMAAALGIGFGAFPRYLLNFQIKGNVGSTEVFMGRCYGMTLLSSCLTWYKTKGSLDATVPLTVMLSRLFMSSVLLMAQLSVYVTTAKKTDGLQFSDQFIPAFVLPTMLWLLGNVLHLIRSDDFNTYPRHNVRVNNHLRIDAWLELMIGVGWLAFPGHISASLWPDKKPANRIAMHVGRCIGALSIGEAVTSLQAPGFLHLQDKKAIFVTRIMMSVVQLGTGVAAFVYLNVTNAQYIALLVAMTLPALVNAAIALFTDGTVIYHVPPPSPSKEGESKTQ